MTDEFVKLLDQGCADLGVTLSDQQKEQFFKYYEMLIEKNKVMNLTAITELSDVITKHFVDSLLLVLAAPELGLKLDGSVEYSCIDVGTGAGFPGIPLKIAFPWLKITLLDSLNKRVGFLNEVIEALGLTDITAVHGRAEDYGRDAKYREQYDICVSRAVANMSTLSEYCIPFVKKGGYFIPYKSGKADEEIAQAEAALSETAEKTATLADRLHKTREKAAAGFEKHILSTLARLGMPETVFRIALTPLAEPGRTGRDSVQFLFTANPRMTPQPVERIASGGELSRVMLALKALLAERMQLPTIIFDEIDTGVSGRIADAMGEIIASLSASMQVVDIPHLPQVASKGTAHFVVYKRGGRTDITRLGDEERVTEIAKMLSGSEITDAAVAQARILLGK